MDINLYSYDKDKIKQSLTIEQVWDLMAEMGAEPRPIQNNFFISRTISHNAIGEGSWKLYYYQNDDMGIFKDYTAGDSFDLFELVRRVKSRESGNEWELPQAVEYVANRFGIASQSTDTLNNLAIKDDLLYIARTEKINALKKEERVVQLKTFDGSFLKNFPTPIIQPWVNEGISADTMNYYHICYNPIHCAVVIPHYNINGELVGIRERTLIKENAEKYGKYLPMKIGKTSYAHPLSFNLYGIYENKNNIRLAKKAIIVEGEKSVMKLDTILGRNNNIGVACCGSAVIEYQVDLLSSLGVTEIIIGLDRQFQEFNDKEHIKLVKNLTNIHNKYGKYIKISYMFDKERITPYKASPVDCGADVFFKLYNERINLY